MCGLLRIFFLYINLFLSYFSVIIISQTGKKGRILVLHLNYNSRLKKVKCCQNTSESKHYNFIFCNEPFGLIATGGFWLQDCIKWFFCILIKNGSNTILQSAVQIFKIVEIDLLSILTDPLSSYMYTSTYTSFDLSRITHK